MGSPPENPPKSASDDCSSMNSGTGPGFFTGQSQVLLTLPRQSHFGNLKQSHEVSSQNLKHIQFETSSVGQPRGVGWDGGEEVPEDGDRWIPVFESCQCMEETDITL